MRSAQRTAVKQRPHQETRRCQVATSEPVVLHHGREGGGDAGDEARPTASTACWAARAWSSVALEKTEDGHDGSPGGVTESTGERTADGGDSQGHRQVCQEAVKCDVQEREKAREKERADELDPIPRWAQSA